MDDTDIERQVQVPISQMVGTYLLSCSGDL